METFKRVSAFWGKPSIDLFASRLNFQFRPFVSWKPDPQAFVIDAISISWTEHNFYAFSPFAIINRVLQKTEQDQSRGVIIVPVLDHSDLVSPSSAEVGGPSCSLIRQFMKRVFSREAFSSTIYCYMGPSLAAELLEKSISS